MISLTNTSGRLQVFVLPHDSFCRALGACACEVRAARPGQQARRVPRSLTLPTGASLDILPDAALSVPGVAAAGRAGGLSITRRPLEPARCRARRPPLTPPEGNAKKKRGQA